MLNGAAVIDDVRRDLTTADYEQVVADLVAELAAAHPIDAIGQFGAVRRPGVSDLDLIIGCQDGDAKTIATWFAGFTQRHALGELFAHGPVLTTPRLTNALPHLHTLEALRWHQGELRLTPVDPLEDSYLSLVWASVMLAASLRHLSASAPGLRQTLLLLQGLEASRLRLGLAAPAALTVTSDELRANVLASPRPLPPALATHVVRQFRNHLHILASRIDVPAALLRSGAPARSPRGVIVIDRGHTVHRAAQGGLRSPRRLDLPAPVFDALLAPWWVADGFAPAQPFVAARRAARRWSERERVVDESASPFGYPAWHSPERSARRDLAVGTLSRSTLRRLAGLKAAARDAMGRFGR